MRATTPDTAFCPHCLQTVRVQRKRHFGARGDFCKECGAFLASGESQVIEPPPCPWCKSSASVRPSGANLKAFFCGRCKREFDTGDDGIDTISYGPPDRRLMREESKAARRPGR